MHQAHSFAAASRCGFQHYRIANLLSHLLSVLGGLDSARSPRHKRHSGFFHFLPSPCLRSHHFHRGGTGANELHASIATRLRKLRILGKKSVSGMDRVRAASLRNVQDLIEVQIGFRRCCRPDVVGLVGLANMQRSPIDVGINRNRWDSEFAAGADHPHSDLPPIRNQNFLEQAGQPSSFLLRRSFTICGFARPFEAFITWPTKKPMTVFFPARYCSTCLGLARMISSITFSIAEESVICCGFSFS